MVSISGTPFVVIEQWFLKMEESLGPLHLGGPFVDDVRNMLSHIRVAQRDRARPMVDERAELQTAVDEVRDLAAETRALIGVLRAEQSHGRRRILTDYIGIASEPRPRAPAESVVLPLKIVEALLDRMETIQVFPQQLDALMKGAAHIPQRH